MREIFFKSVFAVLVLTAIAKIVSAFGRSAVLEEMDLILGFSNRHTYLFASAVELLVAIGIIAFRDIVVRSVLILWLTGAFILYRLAADIYHIPHACPCLGNATEWLHLKPWHAETALKWFVGYMLCGALSSLISHWRENHKCRKLVKFS